MSFPPVSLTLAISIKLTPVKHVIKISIEMTRNRATSQGIIIGLVTSLPSCKVKWKAYVCEGNCIAPREMVVLELFSVNNAGGHTKVWRHALYYTILKVRRNKNNKESSIADFNFQTIACHELRHGYVEFYNYVLRNYNYVRSWSQDPFKTKLAQNTTECHVAYFA